MMARDTFKNRLLSSQTNSMYLCAIVPTHWYQQRIIKLALTKTAKRNPNLQDGGMPT